MITTATHDDWTVTESLSIFNFNRKKDLEKKYKMASCRKNNIDLFINLFVSGDYFHEKIRHFLTNVLAVSQETLCEH